MSSLFWCENDWTEPVIDIDAWTPEDINNITLKRLLCVRGLIDEYYIDEYYREIEQDYILEMEYMLHMLVNEGIVIDEETGEEVYVDPLTFKYHRMTTLYSTNTSL